MRADTAAFALANSAPFKEPRYVVELSFDSANTTLGYFTSHSDAALPGGGTVTHGTVEKIGGTSQTLNPEQARSTIGAISFTLTDAASAVTDLLNAQLTAGRSTRRQRARVHVGYEGKAWADYTRIATQMVDGITFEDGTYAIRCTDIQREMRKDIFEAAATTLATTLTADATTVEVYDSSKFSMVAHGASYSDAPNSTVGYLLIQDEAIRYTGKTATQFTGCTRGALNTRAAEHKVDTGATAERRTEVQEYVYIEMPAVKLAYALLTGILYGQGGATLPGAWHCGIPTSYVRTADFTGIGTDMWDPADDTKGFPVRFEGLGKIDGKKFLEEEILLLCGIFAPVYTDGALGLKRMANVLAGAGYVAQLDERNVVDHGALEHDFRALRNQLRIDWNYEPLRKDTTRTTLLADANSLTVHGRAEPLKRKFRGLHGSRHSSAMLAQRFDGLRDRYSAPPLRLGAKCLHSMNAIEVGDIVRVKLSSVRDFVKGGSLDRSMEVQNISVDWITGNVALKLFGSSAAPGALAPTSDSISLANDLYGAAGTNLATVLTISAGHITANGNLPAGTYYYLGDLTLDAGVTVTINGTVQLRVRGHHTINGKYDGAGRGYAGAAAPAADCNQPYDACLVYEDDTAAGTAGYLGSTIAAGRMHAMRATVNYVDSAHLWHARGQVVSGVNAVAPDVNIAYDGTTLSGIPADLSGTSGSAGGVTGVLGPFNQWSKTATAGAGGASGAGLAIISRGVSFGAAGKIDLSGADGALGGKIDAVGGFYFYSGSGAGGAPGACYFLLDGTLAAAPEINATTCVALQGKTPIPTDAVLAAEDEPHGYVTWTDVVAGTYYTPHTGPAGTSSDPIPDLSGSAAFRVRYIPASQTASADAPAGKLTAPTGLTLSSGTAELLTHPDGTLTPRIKATWTAALDARAIGYELRFKQYGDAEYNYAPPVIGVSTVIAWLAPVLDGASYTVEIRTLGGLREVSDWVVISGFFALGKLDPPSAPTNPRFTDPLLEWDGISDADRRGYIARYRTDGGTDWNSATPAHGQTYLTDSRLDVSNIVAGAVKFLIRALDTSGIMSASVTLDADLRPPSPTLFLISRQPDGTREITMGGATPADFEGWVVRQYLGTTSDWSAMTAMHGGVVKSSPWETNLLAAGTYTFACKQRDWAGNESATPIFITTAIGDPRLAGTVEDVVEEPTWTGTKTNCYVDTATGWLLANGTGTWASAPAQWAAWTEFNTAPVSPINYVREIDIGAVTSYTPLVTITADGTQTIEEAHCDDGSSWTAYVTVGTLITSRYIRIRATIAGSYPKIKMMRTILSGAPVSEFISDLSTSTLAACTPSPSCSTSGYRIAAGDIRLPILKNYVVIKTVGITLQSVGAGWTWVLIDKDTAVGPRIKIYNASGTLADAVIDAEIKGLA